ncbi:MAG: hypothetical protein JXA73_10015 [Acidobacteria bacterium]|nr:hypothetical protein [Acidobacteriota bacterium]
MLVGINYPWINYGWDFGDAPEAWVAGDRLPAWREAKRKQIEEDFGRFAGQGMHAVRWFLLGDGLNYGMNELAPRKAGDKWRCELLPAGHSYYDQLYDDFKFLLNVCRKHGVKIFPSLIDFGWCLQGTPMTGNTGIIKGGRYEILIDPGKRKAFFERTLEPLLAVSMLYRDSIYAWELINEPEWVVRRFWSRNANRTVSRGDMQDFIADGIRRINAKKTQDENAAFLSSVGFADWESLDKWDAERLGITLFQFHYYAQNNRELPINSNPAHRPCAVGEFATAAGKAWPELQRQHRDQSITNRLRCMEDKGYPVCFLWSATATDAATRWTEEAHQELLAYNNLIPTQTIRA